MQTVPARLASSPVVLRDANNPILTAEDVPYKPALVFNAGVTKFQGKYVMVFRNDYGDPETQTLLPSCTTNMGLAFSDDGIHWKARPEPFRLLQGDRVIRTYDPRLTVMNGRCYMCFAVDTPYGVRGGIAVTDDLETFEVLSLSVPDNRNMVLFPEKIRDRYVRLERPFPIYSRGGVHQFDIWISSSPDLRYWGDSELLLAVEDVRFANDKLGPAAPPIKTEKGWLTLFHAVDIDPSRGKNGWEETWKKRYTAGIMLLDPEDPRRIVGRCAEPLLAPDAPYEKEGGFRNDVIFPGGMILEDTGEVKIYYGAADTCECLATAHVGATYAVGSDSAASNGALSYANPNAVGGWAQYTVNVPESGTYNVTVRVKKHPDRGIAQLYIDGVAQGSPIDEYASSPAYVSVDLGNVTFGSAGSKAFNFVVTGKNAASSVYTLATDFLSLTRQPIAYEAETLPIAVSPGDTYTISSDSAASGGSLVFSGANAVGDWVQYTVNVPVAGTYSLSARVKKHPDRGTAQLYIDGAVQGNPLDLRRDVQGYEVVGLGDVTFASAGNKSFKFQITGKDPASSAYTLAFDQILLTRNH